jgi:hypothetical protein
MPRPDHRVRRIQQVFDVQSSKAHSSLGSACRNDGRPGAGGRAVAVNKKATQRCTGNMQRQPPSEAIVSAPASARHPIDNIRLSFH